MHAPTYKHEILSKCATYVYVKSKKVSAVNNYWLVLIMKFFATKWENCGKLELSLCEDKLKKILKFYFFKIFLLSFECCVKI